MKSIRNQRTARGRISRISRVQAPEQLETRLVLSADWKPLIPEAVALKSPDVIRSMSLSEIVVALHGTASMADLAAIPAFASGRLVASHINLAASSRLGSVDDVTLFSLALQPGAKPLPTIDQLQSLSAIAWAAPNYIYQGQVQDFTPDDPRYPEQYHHPLMQNNLAWDLTLGNPNVIIAVMDDGVDVDHPDLAPNIWVNDDPIDGLDNDGNGFVDDRNGWDFADGDNNPDAVSGGDHGTHVAGIAAGRTNNATGIAGTAGNATIMPVRFYRYDNSWTSTVIFNSYQYAANNGADIVSTSYNVDGFVGDPTFEAALNLLNNAGVLYLNSAGNNAELNPPRASFDQVLFVASTTSTDAKSDFSNYGFGIDIASPGSGILSTTPDNSYSVFSGTSMATPNAAGVAALIMSARPSLNRDQVAAVLVATADNIDAQNSAYVGLLGGGRTNSFRAVTESIPAPRVRGVPRITEGATISPIAAISVDFAHVIDPAAGNHAANYKVVGDGPDNTFGTGDDVVVPLTLARTVYYGTNRVRLNMPGFLAADRYRFIVEDTLVDPFGQPLDGNADSTPGGDFVREFIIIETEPNDSISTAIPTGLVNFGTYANTTVIGDGAFTTRDVDFYRIETPPQAFIRAITGPAEDGIEFDSFVRLFDSAGNELVADDNAGFAGYGALGYFSTTGGVFYIAVSGAPNSTYEPNTPGSGIPGAIGNYELTVESRFAEPDAEGDSLAQALITSVGPGTTTTPYSRVARIGDGIALDADVDLYRFEATAGQAVTLRTALPTSGGTSMDTMIRLFDAAGNEITYNDDFDSSLYSLIGNFPITVTGTYYVGVSGYPNLDYDPNIPASGAGDSNGDYELFISLEIAAAEAEGDSLATAFETGIGPGRLPTPFVRSAAIGDGLYNTRDVDLFRFEASAGQTITLATDATPGGTSMDTMIRLFDAAGNQLAIDDDNGPGLYSLISNYAITQTGVYYLGVSGYGNSSYHPNTPNSGAPGRTGNYTLTISKVSPTLQVTSAQLLNSGVQIVFNAPVNTTSLSLYDIQSGAIGLPDLTIVSNGLPVRGSLIPAPDRMSVTFLSSTGVFPSGFLNLTLRSAPDAFVDEFGELLDGDSNGTPGGDFSTSFPIFGAASYTLSIPDIVRGPGQSLSSSPTTPDFPLFLSSGASVGRVDVTLRFNPALLSVTQAVLGPEIPAGWSISTSSPGPGQFRIQASGMAALPGTSPLNIFNIAASVPDTAPYASKNMLELGSVSVSPFFGGFFTTAVDHGLAVVAYPGDMNASGNVSAADVTALRRVITLIDGGFGAFQMVDPALMGDLNATASASAADVTVLRRFLTGQPQTFMPPIPSGISINPSGLDPRLSLPQNLSARPGDRIRVPLALAQTEIVPITLASIDAAIAFDPDFLTLVEVAPGGFGPADEFLVHPDPTRGLLTISAASLQPKVYNPGEQGTFAWLTFQVSDLARPGTSLALNLLDRADTPTRGPVQTLANDGRLLLVPAPTNAPDDPVDGRIAIRKRTDLFRPQPLPGTAPINPDPRSVLQAVADNPSDHRVGTPVLARSRTLFRALASAPRRKS